MKKIVFFLFFIFFLYSCDRATINQIEGTYSYKTSGLVSISDADNNKTYDANLSIVGTLDITRLPKGDSVLLVFNQLGGDAVAIRAEVHRDSILMPPYQIITTIVSEAGSGILDLFSRPTGDEYLLQFGGYGYKYDDMIVFNQSIKSGKVLDSDKHQSVRASDIKTVAKKNK